MLARSLVAILLRSITSIISVWTPWTTHSSDWLSLGITLIGSTNIRDSCKPPFLFCSRSLIFEKNSNCCTFLIGSTVYTSIQAPFICLFEHPTPIRLPSSGSHSTTSSESTIDDDTGGKNFSSSNETTMVNSLSLNQIVDVEGIQD